MTDCILKKGGKANFNIEEFILLVKSMKFVSKYFELNPDNKLYEILKSEYYPKYLFPDNKEFGSNFNYECEKSWYTKKHKELIENFNKNEDNLELLKIVEIELIKFKHL